jgi:glucose-fructose oxidoreductase
MSKSRLTRRDFLRTTAVSAAGAVLFAPRAFGSSPGNTPGRQTAIAHIGVGGQGSGLLRGFLEVEGARSVAVCDAFRSRREAAAELINQKYANDRKSGRYKGCAMYEDFRELLNDPGIDAVVIATPDHWHVPIALAAARAGKDFYVEKPLGISIAHDKALRAAVHRFGNIFQYGTQQRCFNPHCAFASELVRNGYLGKIREIHVDAPAGSPGGSLQPIPVPDGFNYDLWLGPAPVTPYTADRCTSNGTYYVYDNSIGFLGGWGAHPLDVMHWGYPQIPVEYEGTGVIPHDGLFNTVTTWNIRGRFADGTPFTFKDGSDKTTFVGENGWVAASRAGIDAFPKSLLNVVIKPEEIHLLQHTNHYQDFVDCVASRRTPSSHIDTAVQSDFMSHLSDIAIRTGRKIHWDPVREEIVGDPIAAAMQTRPMREPWYI